jgi:uncharacterized protein (TIGR02996 family)
MNEREALLRTIFENPDDDAPRLVYADWLEENKDPLQADFIRVQIGLATMRPGDPREQVLRPRERDLWRTVQRWRFLPRQWLALSLLEYWRGFRAVWCGAAGDFLADAPLLWQDGPPPRGYLYFHFARDAAQAPKLALCPALTCLRSVAVEGESLDDRVARELLSSAHLSKLQSLSLSGQGLTDQIAPFLAACPFAQSVMRLAIRSSSLTDHGWEVLERAFGDRVIREGPFMPPLSTLVNGEHAAESGSSNG